MVLQSDLTGQFGQSGLLLFEQEEKLVLKEEDQSQAKENDRIDIALDPEHPGNEIGKEIRKKGKQDHGHPEEHAHKSLLPTGSPSPESLEQTPDEYQGHKWYNDLIEFKHGVQDLG